MVMDNILQLLAGFSMFMRAGLGLASSWSEKGELKGQVRLIRFGSK